MGTVLFGVNYEQNNIHKKKKKPLQNIQTCCHGRWLMVGLKNTQTDAGICRHVTALRILMIWSVSHHGNVMCLFFVWSNEFFPGLLGNQRQCTHHSSWTRRGLFVSVLYITRSKISGRCLRTLLHWRNLVTDLELPVCEGMCSVRCVWEWGGVWECSAFVCGEWLMSVLCVSGCEECVVWGSVV